MKKIAMVALMLIAFPVLAGCATAMAEKPVTGPKDDFAVLNDLPHDSNENQDATNDASQEAEPEPEVFDESIYEEPDEEAWEEQQDAWYADAYYWDEGTYQGTSQDGETDSQDFRSQGVIYDEGTRYTWYSENVLPGGGLTKLNESGRTVNDDGFVTDGNGRIAVASSDYPIGTELDTPFGPATVYDTGCPSGTIDVYTSY